MSAAENMQDTEIAQPRDAVARIDSATISTSTSQAGQDDQAVSQLLPQEIRPVSIPEHISPRCITKKTQHGGRALSSLYAPAIIDDLLYMSGSGGNVYSHLLQSTVAEYLTPLVWPSGKLGPVIPYYYYQDTTRLPQLGEHARPTWFYWHHPERRWVFLIRPWHQEELEWIISQDIVKHQPVRNLRQLGEGQAVVASNQNIAEPIPTRTRAMVGQDAHIRDGSYIEPMSTTYAASEPIMSTLTSIGAIGDGYNAPRPASRTAAARTVPVAVVKQPYKLTQNSTTLQKNKSPRLTTRQAVNVPTPPMPVPARVAEPRDSNDENVMAPPTLPTRPLRKRRRITDMYDTFNSSRYSPVKRARVLRDTQENPSAAVSAAASGLQAATRLKHDLNNLSAFYQLPFQMHDHPLLEEA